MPLHHHPQETSVLFRKIICICHLLLHEHLFVCLKIWKIFVKKPTIYVNTIFENIYKIFVDMCSKLFFVFWYINLRLTSEFEFRNVEISIKIINVYLRILVNELNEDHISFIYSINNKVWNIYMSLPNIYQVI